VEILNYVCVCVCVVCVVCVCVCVWCVCVCVCVFDGVAKEDILTKNDFSAQWEERDAEWDALYFVNNALQFCDHVVTSCVKQM